MALSDDEQREFEQIQARLLEEDPRFVRRASKSSPAGRRGRHLRIAAALVVVGFLSLLGIVSSVWFGAAGLAMMFVGVVFGARALQTVEGDFGQRVRELLQRDAQD